MVINYLSYDTLPADRTHPLSFFVSCRAQIVPAVWLIRGVVWTDCTSLHSKKEWQVRGSEGVREPELQQLLDVDLSSVVHFDFNNTGLLLCPENMRESSTARELWGFQRRLGLRSTAELLSVGSNPTYLRFHSPSLVSPVFCATFFLDPAKSLVLVSEPTGCLQTRLSTWMFTQKYPIQASFVNPGQYEWHKLFLINRLSISNVRTTDLLTPGVKNDGLTSSYSSLADLPVYSCPVG